MLKYGKDSSRSLIQPEKEICRDLHCQRDRYTWTSHPALEGTNCGDAKWCRSGKCILKTETVDSLPSYTRPKSSFAEKSNYLDLSKSSNALKQEYTFSRVIGTIQIETLKDLYEISPFLFLFFCFSHQFGVNGVNQLNANLVVYLVKMVN